MAIIKCPECGHQTSDKAPVCPSCGVEIAGKITKCSHCGEIYFKSDVVCPHCHKATSQPQSVGVAAGQQTASATQAGNVGTANDVTPPTPITPKPSVRSDNGELKSAEGRKPASQPNDKSKGNAKLMIVSALIAAVVLGVCLYFYNNAQDSNKENEEYEYAMSSDDPMVLQTYLNNFKDAPSEHIDSINAHLQRLMQQDKDWTNAVVSGTKTALSDYLKQHPDSPHKAEALNKIDSIDWAQCSNLNTVDAYQMYIDEHSDGNHYDEAVLAMKKIKANEVTTEERQMIGDTFHKFFVSINSKDEYGLTSTVNESLDLLGKVGATKADVVSFMNKLYKPEVKDMVWSISNNYTIKKKEVGDEQYEYSVSFMATQKVNKTDGNSDTNDYRINAKVNPDGMITVFAMTKINHE